MRLWGALSVLGLVLAALSFGLDQTFKWWMLHVIDIESRQPIALLPVFDVILAWNHGISYGWLSGGASQGFLIALTLAISAGLWTTLTNIPALAADSTIHITNQLVLSPRFYRLRKP